MSDSYFTYLEMQARSAKAQVDALDRLGWQYLGVFAAFVAGCCIAWLGLRWL